MNKGSKDVKVSSAKNYLSCRTRQVALTNNKPTGRRIQMIKLIRQILNANPNTLMALIAIMGLTVAIMSLYVQLRLG
jgi:hypothetical protein